jgi:hypothetical protein
MVERVIQPLQKSDMIFDLVVYKLKVPDVAGGLSNRIFRDKYHSLRMCVCNAEFVKYIGIASRAVRNDHVPRLVSDD